MDPRSAAAGLVLGLGAGLAAGYVAAHRSAPVQPLGSTTSPTATAAPAPGTIAPEEPDARQPTGGAPAVAGDASGKSPRTLAELLDALPAPTLVDASGTGTIRGRLATSEGTPLPGIEIVATVVGAPAQPRPATAGARPLEDVVRETVAEWHRSRATRRTTLTEADGRYQLSGLAQVPWRVYAHAVGYAVSASDDRAWRGLRPDATLDFTATLQFDVQVDVRLPDGSQPSSARIVDLHHFSEHAGGRGERPWSPGRPLSLQAGRHTLTAVVAGEHPGIELQSPETEVTLRAGEAPPSITLRVAGKVGIRGTVVFPDDEVEPSGSVHLLRIAPGTAPNAERLREDGEDEYISGHDLTYEFAGRTPGTYAIGVSRGHCAPVVALTTVEITDRLVAHDITVPPMDPATTGSGGGSARTARPSPTATTSGSARRSGESSIASSSPRCGSPTTRIGCASRSPSRVRTGRGTPRRTRSPSWQTRSRSARPRWPSTPPGATASRCDSPRRRR